MSAPVILRSIADMTLANAERVAFDLAEVEISAEAAERISTGRVRFESFLNDKGGYIYGSTTAPGSRAKRRLSAEESLRQGETLRKFIPLQPGTAGERLPERCVRLAVFARLSNALTGSGKLRVSTAKAVASLLQQPPPVPLQATACSGEVMPLAWLAAPLGDLPLATGEAMALINGSPFATAMACDVALTTLRRLRLAEWIFVKSIEAAACPAAHFDRRLADRWRDPFYEQSLERLSELLGDCARAQLDHQAPTCWRVLPNVLAEALRAVGDVAQAAQIGLQSLKDNPTFIQADRADDDVVLSSGGYHDHRSAKAIDAVNSALLDLGVLASRQVCHLLDGRLGLPPLLSSPEDGVGMEYLAWGMTEPLATAARAAQPTTLEIGLQDPAGNQSDVTSLGFVAYGKHREVSRSFDACLATLAVTAARALNIRAGLEPSRDAQFYRQICHFVDSSERAVDIVGEPVRRAKELIRVCADEMPAARFAESLIRGARA
ncbi:aromatic amino acid lyase [Caballeronia mineralivorans]|uniref:aromatic amino acid lyase n=1 Tax=Caballeronia mineralivorans TaxID=2010198 RepID=UPI0023F086AA|nr:aromatic amino acid lyase [Caballeronia mineralivorans]MDB5782052.1 histidine ammonia-lyase [Caballeronia mineralivorans]